MARWKAREKKNFKQEMACQLTFEQDFHLFQGLTLECLFPVVELWKTSSAHGSS